MGPQSKRCLIMEDMNHFMRKKNLIIEIILHPKRDPKNSIVFSTVLGLPEAVDPDACECICS